MNHYPSTTSPTATPPPSKHPASRYSSARAGLALVLATGLTACASNLVVTEEFPTGEDAKGGLPIHQRVPAIEFFLLNSHSKETECRPLVQARRTMLPIGEPLYVNVDPEYFATASLTVKYASDGGVQEIAFGTEPSGDAIEAATTALSTLLPFVGVTSSAPAEPAEAGPGDEKGGEGAPTARPLCDSGEISLNAVPVGELGAEQILNEAERLMQEIDNDQGD
jgi:hypothetical protein